MEWLAKPLGRMTLYWARRGFARNHVPPVYDLGDRPGVYGGPIYGSLEWLRDRWALQLGGGWVDLDLGADTEAAMGKAMQIAAGRPLRRVN